MSSSKKNSKSIAREDIIQRKSQNRGALPEFKAGWASLVYAAGLIYGTSLSLP